VGSDCRATKWTTAWSSREGSQSDATIGTARNLEHEVVDIAVAPHQRLTIQSAFKFNPIVVVDQPQLQLSMMNAPMPYQEVEVMDT
jgi:hypothetical protein